MKHCIVGDVHGEYQALLNLVAKTPEASQLIFVGDLIDRGAQSAYVVKFIRKHHFHCVKGNHEAMMVEYGTDFVHAIENNEPIDQDNIWLKNGGIETLLSYDLISLRGSELVPHPFIREFIFQFKDDIEWMRELPLYLELDGVEHVSNRPVVVSHSAIAPVWEMRNQEEHKRDFIQKVMWSRMEPSDQVPIFNIFGHTPQKFNVNIEGHYVNVDTGCYIKREEGYGLLSAYCVETGEVYSSGEINYRLTA